ncbi:tyrosine protein phosphatase 1 [Dispira parvispora]|uniref:Tyrosine protein phosphatase 1 n=1 Tax=Dispira parvispora TaxID=1520584 RepID=A0A9W8E286_9FUNG|nr:tyrosine protein phosphatase 1 [Dispira parvispora]
MGNRAARVSKPLQPPSLSPMDTRRTRVPNVPTTMVRLMTPPPELLSTSLSIILYHLEKPTTKPTLHQRFEWIGEEENTRFAEARTQRHHPCHNVALYEIYAHWDLDRYTNILPFNYNRVQLSRNSSPSGERTIRHTARNTSSPGRSRKPSSLVSPDALAGSKKAPYRIVTEESWQDVGPPEDDLEFRTDYINASWIFPPWRSGQVYIATQAPLASTIADFWWMVWQERVRVIAMLSKEVERGVLKCHVYWPADSHNHDEGHRPYLTLREVGLRVTLIDETYNATLGSIIRRLEISSISSSSESNGSLPPLEVTQIHYQYWPDHGVPSEPVQFYQLWQAIKRCQGKARVPVVVHCSAGCGRTGTLIAFDYALYILQNSHECPDRYFTTPPGSSDTLIKESTLRSDEAPMSVLCQGADSFRTQLLPLIQELFDKHWNKSAAEILASGDVLFDITRYLRAQRVTMVQSFSQYYFCYFILLHYLQQSGATAEHSA